MYEREKMFQVGDKVRRIVNSSNPDLYGVCGEVYTVSEILSDGYFRVEELLDLVACVPANFEKVEQHKLPEKNPKVDQVGLLCGEPISKMSREE